MPDIKSLNSYSRTREITFCESAVKLGELEKDPLTYNRMPRAKNGVKQNQKEEFCVKRNFKDFAKRRKVRYSLL